MIRPSCYADIPNAFTPNGDGYNDFFFTRAFSSSNVQAIHLQIFNRWGQMLFETYRLDGLGWDGRFNGQAQSQDTYSYKQAMRLGCRPEIVQGQVRLLR